MYYIILPFLCKGRKATERVTFALKRRGRENVDHGNDAQRGEALKVQYFTGPWGNRRTQSICRMSNAESEQMKGEVTEDSIFSEAVYGNN